jgi:GTP-binding protein
MMNISRNVLQLSRYRFQRSYLAGSSSFSTEANPIVEEKKPKGPLFTPEELDSLSLREKLRRIEPDRKILHHLDAYKLGYLPTRRTRVAVARKWDKIELEIGVREKEKAKYPFSKTGVELFKMHNFNFHKMMDFPENPPQIAVIGRSNVGKSTLVNALVGFDSSYVQKAQVSDVPGETKWLTFYQLGKIPKTIEVPQKKDPSSDVVKMIKKEIKFPAFLLVDMPGFGFAFMSDDDKKRCEELYIQYLLDSQYISNCPIKRVILLLDARHGLKKTDIDFLELFAEKLKEYRRNDRNPKFLEQKILKGLNPEDVAKYHQLIEEDLLEGDELEETETTTTTTTTAMNTTTVVEASSSNNQKKKEKNTTPPTTSSSLLSQELKFRHSFPKKLSWKLQIVITKCDLIERGELCKRIQLLKYQLVNKMPSYLYNDLAIIPVSGKEFTGFPHLHKELISQITHPEAIKYMNHLQYRIDNAKEYKKIIEREEEAYRQQLQRKGLHFREIDREMERFRDHRAPRRKEKVQEKEKKLHKREVKLKMAKKMKREIKIHGPRDRTRIKDRWRNRPGYVKGKDMNVTDDDKIDNHIFDLDDPDNKSGATGSNRRSRRARDREMASTKDNKDRDSTPSRGRDRSESKRSRNTDRTDKRDRGSGDKNNQPKKMKRDQGKAKRQDSYTKTDRNEKPPKTSNNEKPPKTSNIRRDSVDTDHFADKTKASVSLQPKKPTSRTIKVVRFNRNKKGGDSGGAKTRQSVEYGPSVDEL